MAVKNVHRHQAQAVQYLQSTHIAVQLECWAVPKRDVLKIYARNQWRLQKLLGIKYTVTGKKRPLNMSK